MVLLPVAAREVREASRQPRTYAWRWITAGVALLVMAFFSWVTRWSNSQGHDLFVTVSTVAYIYCLLAGVVRTADAIAEEKRENTLGLLFLTDLKGWDIILGKLLSSSVNCLFGLLALIPMIAIPMMMGGVPWSEFVRVVLSLLNTLLVSISYGFLISSLFRLSVVTISSGLALMIILGGGLPLLALLLDEEYHLRAAAAAVFIFSPTHCHVMAFDTNAPGYIQHYWKSLALNFGIALLNLRLAIFFLPKFWQEAPKNKKTETWRNRIREWRFGKARTKKQLRTRLLNQNPFFWLANREQVSSAGLLITIFVILLGALGLGLAWSSPGGRNADEILAAWLFGLAFVHIIIAFRMAMSASYRLAEDRRSGALELLLGTEATIRELLRGYWMGLGRQFFGPILIVVLGGAFAVCMLLLLFSDSVFPGRPFATGVEVLRRLFVHEADKEAGFGLLVMMSIQAMLALNWIGLIWVGMWFGLRERRPGTATWTTLALVLLPPWVIFIAGMVTFIEVGISRGLQPDEAFKIALTCGWFLGLTHIGILSWSARKNLLTRFREAAADRYMRPRGLAWPKIRRIAVRFAAAGACVVFTYYGWRAFIDRRGEKAWAAALAAYPNFKLHAPLKLQNVPDAKNLAQAPLVRAVTGAGMSGKLISWNLSSSQRGGWGENLTWNWPARRRMDLPYVERVFVERKIAKKTNEVAAVTVLEGLAEYDEKLAELREEAAARPLLEFTLATPPRDPNAPFMQYYYAYNVYDRDVRGPVRDLIRTLVLRTSAKMAMGDFDSGDLFLALRFAQSAKDMPHSTFQYHEMLLDCVQPIYDAITRRAWKNEDLKRVQDFFAGIDTLGGFEVFREEYLRQIIDESETIARARRGDDNRLSWVAKQAPTGILRKWEAETLRWGMTDLPKIVDVKARRVDAEALRNLTRTRPEPPHSWRQPDEVAATIRSAAFVQTSADQIVIACALERFRSDHGALPKDLRELAPNYLSKVPHDTFTGDPMRYVLSADGAYYTLYSVGPDGTDNNGVPAGMPGSWMFWQDQLTTDWVWRSDSVDPRDDLAPKKKKRK